jgi:hypothetical protein
MSKAMSLKDWVDGLKSPGGALATRGESRSEAAGHAVRGSLEGGAVAVAVGIANSLLPGGLSPGKVGLAAVGATMVAAVTATKSYGRSVSNAAVALTAIAVYEHAGNKAAHAAGTSSAVLTNKAKAIAAHGEDDIGGLNAGADPLLEAGARIFGS